MIVFIICFPALAITSEKHHDWVVRAALGIFAFLLCCIATYLGIIAVDEYLRRRYGSAIGALALIIVLVWPIASCLRGALQFQSQ
jgi:Na+/proline symporter